MEAARKTIRKLEGEYMMNEAIRLYYKELLKTGFKHAGLIENPSIIMNYDTTKGHLCDRTGDELHVYISIHEGLVNDAKYVGICEATLNVAVEVLCYLVKGRSINEIKNLNDDAFIKAIGSHDDKFLKKARILLDFLKDKVYEYEQDKEKPIGQDIDNYYNMLKNI
jgi:NifU-like protein involved in Fe-S cluster formation